MKVGENKIWVWFSVRIKRDDVKKKVCILKNVLEQKWHVGNNGKLRKSKECIWNRSQKPSNAREIETLASLLIQIIK